MFEGMSTRAVTTPVERVDLHICFIDQFLALDLVGEAKARARHALAQCGKELRAPVDAATRRQIEERRVYLEHLLRKLGADPAPDPREHATI